MNAAAASPWYRALNRSQWNVLLASNLGWLFDGYETYALILTVGVALHQLLDPSEFGSIPIYAGTVIGITLLGWGIGGLIGGVLADYIGRKRTMILAILAYSLMTGVSALSWSWLSFALLRFLVGIAIGSEWATGASIIAELWPDRARGKGAGLMQCGLGIGFFTASLVWVFVSPYGPNAWRFMFLVGILPGLFTLWIRRGIPESPVWERSSELRKAAVARKKRGDRLDAADHGLTRFTLAELFADPKTRLSLPKIISANNDCVVRRGLGWRGGFHIVVSVVAAAHPYPIQDACASHCNTPNTRSGSAADAVRQRSERDPNSRAVASRSDVQRTGFATATSGRSGGHESPSFSPDL